MQRDTLTILMFSDRDIEWTEGAGSGPKQQWQEHVARQPE